jgi:ABC-type sugar transport system ATPase subunit
MMSSTEAVPRILLSVRNLIPSADHAGLYGAHGLSFDLHIGDFLVVVGKSGSGKSTLLELLLGTRKLGSGEITLFRTPDNPLILRAGRDFAERKFGIVFQDYGLFAGKTVKENLEFVLRAQQIDPKEWPKKLTSVMDRLELTNKVNLESKVDHLSGGEKQRVALARLLLVDRTVYLFDEPLSNIDSPLRQSLLLHFMSLREELNARNAAAIYVTHSYAEALSLATSILVIRDKTGIEQLGSPEIVYKDPVSRFVAEFLGDAGYNFVPLTRMLARVRMRGRQSAPHPPQASPEALELKPLTCDAIDSLIPAEADRSHDGYLHGYRLGFRPECLVTLEDVDATAGSVCFDVVSRREFFRGKDTLVVGVDEELESEIRWISGRTEGRHGKQWRAVAWNDCRVYCCETGARDEAHHCTDACNWKNISIVQSAGS